jgi:IclR family transcriptional regulator, KDG regulon repressor
MRNESVVRAFNIIEYLAETPGWVGPRMLARDLDLDPATALRFLNSLKDLGYVRRDPQKARYQLTLKFAWLGAKLLDKLTLRAVALPFLETLSSATNETTHLAVLDNLQIVYIAKLDTHQPIQMRSRIGNRGYLHSTALGRAILAHLPPDERSALLPLIERPALTEHTLTELNALTEALRLVRECGYAIDNEENEIGIRCIAAPVFDHLGGVIGAVSLSGWTLTMTEERVERLAADLLKTCEDISREMGFHG